MIYREQESIPLVECSRTRSIGENSHDDYLPFPLDEESIRKKRNLSHSMLKGTVKPDSGFSVDIGHKNRICSPSEVVAISSGYAGHRHDSRESPGVPAKDIFFMVQKPTSSSSKGMVFHIQAITVAYYITASRFTSYFSVICRFCGCGLIGTC